MLRLINRLRGLASFNKHYSSDDFKSLDFTNAFILRGLVFHTKILNFVKNKTMDGIYFLEDETGNKRFVQIDLAVHADLWEDFYDALVVAQRKDEESVPFSEVLDLIKKNERNQVAQIKP